MNLKVDRVAATKLQLAPGEVLVLRPPTGTHISPQVAERIGDAFIAAFAAAGVEVDRRRILIAGWHFDITTAAA